MNKRACSILGAVFLMSASLPVRAQTTCAVSRAQVTANLAVGVSADELAVRYSNCTAADLATSPVRPAPVVSPSETITYPGSIYYEAIRSCGYQPQREEANCTVEIRQRVGYGGTIGGGPGSHEYLLFCVDFGLGLGLVPVNTNGVHVHDESRGAVPTWSFSATIQSNAALLQLPNNGRTLSGRVILSWAIPPANCNSNPVWGNRSDFRFRLDP